MAYTAGTGFRYWKTLSGNPAAPAPQRFRIANSTTLRIGDLVRVNNAGLLVTSASGSAPCGVLKGFVDQNGINPFSLGYSGAGVTLTGDDTLATASDNTTRAQYITGEVYVDVAGDILWLNDSDGSLAQTNVFQFFDPDANGRQVASGTASDSNGVLQLIEWDPQGTSNEPGNPVAADASKGAFRIAENQFGIGIDTGTAKVAA